MVKKSLSCLKASLTGNRIATLGNTYTTALMAYVFTLAGDIQTRKTLLDHLNIVAVREGKPGLPVTSAWILSSARAKPTSRLFRFCRRLPSLESEVSWDVSFSVGGDQRLRHAGFPQQIAAHHGGTGPSLKHRQVAHPAAEPLRRLLVYPGNLEDEVLDMSWLEHLVYHSWMLNRLNNEVSL